MPYNLNILLVDDNRDIHVDFNKILFPERDSNSLAVSTAALLGKASCFLEKKQDDYTIHSAYQGQEALAMVTEALEKGQPYALAFVDVRMPPGWDGILTINHLWEVDPDLEIVICTAHSDYNWDEMYSELEFNHSYLILKKPFDAIEIKQLAASLTKKWHLKRQVKKQLHRLQNLTHKLEKSLSLVDATLEATADGIVVIDQNQKIVKYNQLFLDLWGISEKMVKTEKIDTIFQKLANKVQESDISFLNKIQATRDNNIEVNKIREWTLKGGRILECYCQPQYLHNEIMGTVYSFRDITEQKKLEERLIHQATHDTLTGLYNRVLLVDRVLQAIIHAKRYGLLVGLLLIDIDNFKQINDIYGHEVGDKVLKWLSQKLSLRLREEDTIARLGGDEFVVLVSSFPQMDNLATVAKSIMSSLTSTPCLIATQSIPITVSIGISAYPNDGQDYETLLKNADLAMYQAKVNGRNTFEFYQKEVSENNLHIVKLKSDLSSALEKKELLLEYQPLVSLLTNKIIGFEALLRWKHPNFGLVLPQVFIPLAEESSLIIPIGEWVLKTACLQHQLWRKAGFSSLQMAVNISALQLRPTDFIEKVRQILEETDFEPSQLELEITESILMCNNYETIQKMNELKKLGVRLSIDDFGTGYSSLSSLKFFPFNKLKIDKSFIDEIVLGGKDYAMVEAIIRIAKKLGLEVIAEGVEKLEQVQYLREHHSDQVQGYYFGRPMAANDCSQLLKKQESGQEDLYPGE